MLRKFWISILYLNCLYLSAQEQGSVLEERISIQFSNTSLPAALRQLNRQSKISFSYNSSIIPKEAKFTKTFENKEIRGILEDLFKGQDLYFREFKSTVIILKSRFTDRKIKGRVVDSQTKEPLMFANTFIDNSTLGVATNTNGEFIIENIPNSAVDLVVSYVGYKSKRTRVDYVPNVQIAEVFIELDLDAIALESVQVLGKARRKKTKEERKLFRNFTSEFLGRSDRADDCVIENPQVLEIEILDSLNNYSVRADERVFVQNNALGYRIAFLLEEFRFVNGQKMLVGNAKFEEKEARSRRQYRKWRQARAEAYKGSLQHFLNSLIENRLEEEGFLVNVVQYDSVTSEYTTPLNPPPVEDIITVSPTDNPYIYNFKTISDIEITYTRAYEDDGYKKRYRSSSKSGNYKYTDKKSRSSISIGEQSLTSYQIMGLDLTEVDLFQKSILFFRKKELEITYPGQFNDGSSFFVGGWWRWGAFSDLVPLNYQPEAVQESN
jgi:hypothetical protein